MSELEVLVLALRTIADYPAPTANMDVQNLKMIADNALREARSARERERHEIDTTPPAR